MPAQIHAFLLPCCAVALCVVASVSTAVWSLLIKPPALQQLQPNSQAQHRPWPQCDCYCYCKGLGIKLAQRSTAQKLQLITNPTGMPLNDCTPFASHQVGWSHRQQHQHQGWARTSRCAEMLINAMAQHRRMCPWVLEL